MELWTTEKLNLNGYVLIKNFFNKTQRNDLDSWTNQLKSFPESKNCYMKYYETKDNKRLLSRMENFLDYHNDFSLFELEVIRPLVESIFKEPVVLFKEKINFKLPGGGAFEPHQDHPAWSEFPSTDYINIAIPIDEMTDDNGTLYFASGIGRDKKIYHDKETNKIDDKLIDSWKWEPVYGNLGDLLMFNSYVPHRSFINKTNNPRRVYFLTYNKLKDGNYRESYFKTKREKFPPDIEKEKGKDYSKIGSLYNLGNPMNTKT